MTIDTTKITPEKLAEMNDSLITDNNHLRTELVKAKAELETERLRLAACGTAALGYFEDCKDEYRSASLGDILRLYEQNKRYRATLEKLACLGNGDQHGNSIGNCIAIEALQVQM